MKLNWFVLQMSPDENFEPLPNKEYAKSNTNNIESTFNWRCDSFLDFVTRRIRKSKIETNKFNFISIHLCSNPKPNFRLFDKILTIDIDAEEGLFRNFEQFDENGLNSFFVRKAKEGLEKLHKEKNNIPFKSLMNIIEDFENNKFLNIWIQESKKIKKLGIEIKLVAQSTIQSFTLKFQVFENDNLIFTKTVMETLPSPTFYYYEFKELKILKTRIQILKRDKSILTSIHFKEFEKYILKK